jgi:hypothetical protein
VNVISWSGRALLFTFPKHTHNKGGVSTDPVMCGTEELVLSLQMHDWLRLECLEGAHIWDLKRRHLIMNRNLLYLIIGALGIATAVLGYQFYQHQQKPTGIEIDVGKNGVSIEKK